MGISGTSDQLYELEKHVLVLESLSCVLLLTSLSCDWYMISEVSTVYFLFGFGPSNAAVKKT